MIFFLMCMRELNAGKRCFWVISCMILICAFALSTHVNRRVQLKADGKSPGRCITLRQITPGIMIDLLVDVHEGA